MVNADGTVDVKVKVSRGTDNPDYQEALAEAWLFVSENMYVGDFSYSPNYSTRISGAAIGMVQFDQVYTIRTGQPGGYNPAGTYTPFPAFSRKYFLRFGARTTRQFDGTNRLRRRRRGDTRRMGGQYPAEYRGFRPEGRAPGGIRLPRPVRLRTRRFADPGRQ